MTLASWGPLGKGLGALLGRLGGFLGSLEAVLGVLVRSFGDSRPLGPSWGPLGALLAPLGTVLGSKKSRGEQRGAPGNPRQSQAIPGNLARWGPGP